MAENDKFIMNVQETSGKKKQPKKEGRIVEKIVLSRWALILLFNAQNAKQLQANGSPN